MTPPLIKLTKVWREYPSGEGTFAALKDVDLEIQAGEMVAIMGASGSGKSTLMNVLGCLDRPTSGTYEVAGRDTSTMTPDELAELRRRYFGFIFQRYHLLTEVNALRNVEMPAVYANVSRTKREGRARELLTKLGLRERISHLPGQLSGGQQQRVSIARALMNGGQVILADEPTGALDRESGQQVMRILLDLNAEGHTVVLVTHDANVAANAARVIELSDGLVVGDKTTSPGAKSKRAVSPIGEGANTLRVMLDRAGEAFRMALIAMAAHRLRTFLTMLGIIIGVASVVSVVALGTGSQQRILSDISGLGTNTLDVYPGSDFGDQRSSKVQTLTPADADALATQSYVDSVTPNVSSSVTARVGNVAATAQVNGIGEGYFRVKGLEIAQGRFFGADAVRARAQEIVIDENSKNTLFPSSDPIGQVVVMGNVPAVVIGVVKKKQAGFGPSDSLNIYAPYTTVMTRLLGQSYLRGITVRVSDSFTTAAAGEAVTALLKSRHGTQDFFINNTDDIRKTITSATQTMTLLVGAIAVISLLVGGIGVMNIMLVSVTERTSEIGVRMAVGARQSDIMQQFLIEAVLVCFAGGLIGVGLALAIGALFAQSGANFQMVFSLFSIGAAFASSTLIGVVFGFLPARNAARLDPVEALARN